MSDAPLISVVSPVYGCRGCLTALVEAIQQSFREIGCQGEIVLVDDNSPDDAWPVIENLALTKEAILGVRLSRNFGQHAAILAGLERTRGQWVVVMDCDMQDPPSAIPKLYQKAIESGSDGVFAQRLERQDSIQKRFSSWAFHRTLSWLTGVPQDGSTANFGIFRRPVIDAVISMPERSKAFPLMVRWVGFEIGTMPVPHGARAEGRSGYTLGKMIGLALSIVLGYSDKPLRMVAGAGVVCSLISVVFAVGTLLMFLGGDIQVAGYTSIMTALWLLSGLIMFGLGVVGLYVGQVFENVQGRPSSVVRETVGPNGAHDTNVASLGSERRDAGT